MECQQVWAFFTFLYMGKENTTTPTKTRWTWVWVGGGLKDCLNFWPLLGEMENPRLTCTYFLKVRLAIKATTQGREKTEGVVVRVFPAAAFFPPHQDFENILSSLMSFFKLAVGETYFCFRRTEMLEKNTFTQNKTPDAPWMEYLPTFVLNVW